MKLSVGMKAVEMRKQSGESTKPISPMSWYSGSHDTALSSGPPRRPSRMIALQLAARLPCVTITPLGNAVLPEVNCRKATSSSRTSAASGNGAPGSAVSSSAAITFSAPAASPRSGC